MRLSWSRIRERIHTASAPDPKKHDVVQDIGPWAMCAVDRLDQEVSEKYAKVDKGLKILSKNIRSAPEHVAVHNRHMSEAERRKGEPNHDKITRQITVVAQLSNNKYLIARCRVFTVGRNEWRIEEADFTIKGQPPNTSSTRPSTSVVAGGESEEVAPPVAH